MNILLALLVFSLIIVFHEFGHYLFARLCGVHIEEFSVGFGPRLLSVEKGGTKYSLKALPLGGSCMMKGEDYDDLSEDSFFGRPVWQRMLIVAAGPVFNFLLAWILSVILIANAGVDLPVVLSVTEGYPAEAAGLEAGDRIRSINGKKIHFYREVTDYCTFHQDRLGNGKESTISWEHEGEIKTASFLPAQTENGRWVIGISGTSQYREPVSVGGAVRYAAYEAGYWISLTWQSLGMLIHGTVSVNDLSGPVGLVNVINDTVEESKPDGVFYVFLNLLNIAILLSANLGVMNLLPIPALDGGRLFFLLLEAIRRKRLDPEIEARINLVGIFLLLLLMAFVMVNDIRKIF